MDDEVDDDMDVGNDDDVDVDVGVNMALNVDEDLGDNESPLCAAVRSTQLSRKTWINPVFTWT
jgi:hypothetical protein